MSKIIGLINLHSKVSLDGLTARRPVASVSFLGRYGIIDFVLSNMSNSGIKNVGVLIQEKPRSLFKHFGSGNHWNFNAKSGGVFLLYNEQYANTPRYNHDINNLLENRAFLNKSSEEYVVISPAHIIATIDYKKVVAEHIKSGADITMMYKTINYADKSCIGSDCLELKGKQIVAIEPNRGDRATRNVCMETYIMSMKELYMLMEKARTISSFFSLRDILTYICQERLMIGYEYEHFVRLIDSYDTYYKVSLEFLKDEVSTEVFRNNWPIYTRTNDTPPTKYLKHAEISNSFIANGAIIDGTVEHSVISRNVVIEKGAVVKNCIILSDAVVSEDAHLENVIMDKTSKVIHKKELIGSTTPLFIKEGDIV